MRTTINVDDDVFELVSRYAERRSLSLGRAVSELVRRGLESRLPVRVVNGIQVFELPENSPKVTSSKVQDLESQTQ